MSLEIVFYANRFSDELIPKMVERLNTFEMICEVHPDFSFYS